MSVCLATSWYPRGELPRFRRLLPMLEEKYAGIVISFIPSDDQNVIQQFRSGKFSSSSKLTFHVNNDGRNGRYFAVKESVGYSC